MSEPMRFNLKHFGQISTMEVAKDGEFVLHSDYAHLKAEVERLRNAGDAMAIDCAQWCMSDQGALGLTLEITLEHLPSVIAWNAAKQPPTDPTK